MPCTMSFAKALLVALDQLGNALLGGWPDETLSSRAFRLAKSGRRRWPRRLIDALFFWDRKAKNATASFPLKAKGKDANFLQKRGSEAIFGGGQMRF